MSTNDETPSQALRELARWVVRDRIDSDHLERYMRALLSTHLIELHASCRCEALVIARGHPGMAAKEVAGQLCRCACELERRRPAMAGAMSQDYLERPSDEAAEFEMIGPNHSEPVMENERQLSWFPELIAAVVFAALCVSLLCVDCDNSALRVTASSGYGCLALIYVVAVIRLVWRKVHPAGSLCK